MPDTAVQTMQDFFIWTMSPQPQLDKRISFDAALQLGIFSWLYQIPSLSNQVTDVISRNLASGKWKLQATIVDDVYGATPEDSPLREVVRAALGQLPQVSGDEEGITRAEWKATFRKHADLGWDYIEASRSEWSRQEYLSDVCRFHDHKGVAFQNGSLAPRDGCPYAQDECYPMRDETEEVDEVTHLNGVHRPGEGLETVEEVNEAEEVELAEASTEAIDDEAAASEEESAYPPEDTLVPASDPGPDTELESYYPDEEPASVSEPVWGSHDMEKYEETPQREYSDPPADIDYAPVGEPAHSPAEKTAADTLSQDPRVDAEVRSNARANDTSIPAPTQVEAPEHEHEPTLAEEAAPSESVPDDANGTVMSDMVVEDGFEAHTNGGIDGELDGRTMAAPVGAVVAEVETPNKKKKKHKSKKH